LNDRGSVAADWFWQTFPVRWATDRERSFAALFNVRAWYVVVDAIRRAELLTEGIVANM